MIARPTPEMLAWHDYEVGLFFHYDIEVFDRRWSHETPGPLPEARLWKPERLDTDQWLDTAVAAGARYALLTAKHSTGFCLWPTDVHDYHVGNAPVPRDVVGEFVASCRSHGVEHGLYYSLTGQHLSELCTDGSGTLDRERMNAMLLAQVEELITRYGPLCEMWFDGGVLRPERGGPDIPGLLARIAPDLVCFGGPPGVRNVLRWSGSEQGVALPECWSTARFLDDPERKNVTCDSPGDPDDPVWAPVEVDIPSRDVLSAWMGGWMYDEADAVHTFSGAHLFARYLTSVGRNANLLVGCVPDTEGRISPDQVDAFASFGAHVRRLLGSPVGETAQMTGETMELRFEKPVDIGFIEILEDQTNGQLVREWAVELRWPQDWIDQTGKETWIVVAEGRSIGHKRIVQLNALRALAIRVRVVEARPGAKLRAFRAFASVDA